MSGKNPFASRHPPPRGGHLQDPGTDPRPGQEYTPGAVAAPLQATDASLREGEARLLDLESFHPWEAVLRIAAAGTVDAYQIVDAVPYNHITVGLYSNSEVAYYLAVVFGFIGAPGKVTKTLADLNTSQRCGHLVVIPTVSNITYGFAEFSFATHKSPFYVVPIPVAGAPGANIDVAVKVTQSFRL